MNQSPFKAVLSDEDAVRDVIGVPIDIAVKKARPSLDKFSRELIDRSPFLTIGTANANGKADVSPRGDAPGFVRILDDNTIFIPERPGNNRVDTLTNITENPNVGLLFMVPGFDETLRVNGRASVVKDEKLLEQCAVKGRIPKLGIMVAIEEAYLHCAKAFRRSKLWDAESLQDRKEMPSLGKIIMEQTAADNARPSDEDIATVDTLIEENYRNELY